MARPEFKFSFPFRVRYSEIDGQGVVFNAHYLTYYDTAVTEYLRNLNFDYEAQVRDSGEDFHTVKSMVEYKAPIYFDEEIEVYVRAARVGRTSLTFKLEIHSKDKDELKAHGEIIWVNTNQTTHKPAPLPQSVINMLCQFEGEYLMLS